MGSVVGTAVPTTLPIPRRIPMLYAWRVLGCAKGAAQFVFAFTVHQREDIIFCLQYRFGRWYNRLAITNNDRDSGFARQVDLAQMLANYWRDGWDAQFDDFYPGFL